VAGFAATAGVDHVSDDLACSVSQPDWGIRALDPASLAAECLAISSCAAFITYIANQDCNAPPAARQACLKSVATPTTPDTHSCSFSMCFYTAV
jgi:hypothetical protein